MQHEEVNMDQQFHPNNPISGFLGFMATILWSLHDVLPDLEFLLKTLSCCSVSMIIVINWKPFIKSLKDRKNEYLSKKNKSNN